ncbi:helix-turn-helix domain-containing protein [Chryseobacterium soli]|uniref:helix-turn-helix domain-containing protein n=1 Tax=Chryseobacterium soli TaxID=445961 RepID=UPI002955AD12|nr:helix-turn-helix domain-containing protein [Chryseobacterium soli]MDV7697038.1 helix-turn-helix domain-containing protein [Chryseobacterium soli]
MEKLAPNYKKIFTDILIEKHPEKYERCHPILQKEVLSMLDVIKLNQMIFAAEDKGTAEFSRKQRSYDESSILEILAYQKRNGYNNTQVASKFKLSRNSVAKWRKIFNQ